MELNEFQDFFSVYEQKTDWEWHINLCIFVL